ncbi:hypothetical protein F5141DRAFT_1267780 [Pisolithus sp. B1]|nr:hypothetical protein F5141DRAFT_1267780 [Pisolithus sp. B1]
MKELFDARAELAHLQRREWELVKELLDVHKAVTAQKLVIDELIKASTIPHVNRLPNELLAQLFLLLSHERESLASVSRRWRVVIMDTPSIWSEINLRHYEGRPRLLKLHLERSRQIPLTVSLHDDQPELDVTLLHVSRIRALRIFGGAPDILSRFASLTLPALEFLLVDLNSEFVDLLLSLYSRTPALKCLQLHGLYEPLLLTDPAAGHLNSSTPRNMYPVESLTELSLRGAIDDWRLTPNSIHFPVLESLALRINYPVSFLEAIVAPKLERFEFSRSFKILPIYSAFNGPTSKFDNVRHFICSASPRPEMVWQGGHAFYGLVHEAKGLRLAFETRIRAHDCQQSHSTECFQCCQIQALSNIPGMLRVSGVVLRSRVFPDVSLYVSRFIAVSIPLVGPCSHVTLTTVIRRPSSDFWKGVSSEDSGLFQGRTCGHGKLMIQIDEFQFQLDAAIVTVPDYPGFD